MFYKLVGSSLNSNINKQVLSKQERDGNHELLSHL